MSVLTTALDQLGKGEDILRLVEITGDAGIGKTALLGEFSRHAREGGAVVLTGRGGDGFDERPFGTFVDAFQDNDEFIHAAMADCHVDLRSEFDAVFSMATAWDREPNRPSPREMIHRGYWAIRELLRQLSLTKLVLILDDAHCADPASLELMARLLRQPPRTQVLLVLGYRDRQAGAKLRLAVASRSQQVVATRVHLGPLSEVDVETMLAGRGTIGWRQRLYRDSGGNPAYLKALLSDVRPISPQHRSAPDRGTQSADRATFLAELRTVAPEVMAVAEAAAVAGNDFDADLVAQILDQPEPGVLAAIGDLIDRDLARPNATGQYFAFRHPVVHGVIYDSIELSRRVDMHLRADAVLRLRDATAIERARHVVQGARHGDMKTVGVLDSAAQAVMDTDPRTAAVWLTTALRVLPERPDLRERKARMLIRVAKARGASGHLRECRDTMHEALSLLPAEDPTERASAIAFIAGVQRLLGAHAETDALLRTEINLLGEDGSLASASLKFELAAVELANGDVAACVRWALEALATAQRRHDRCLQVGCLGVLAKASIAAGQTRTAAGQIDQAVSILDGMLDGEFGVSVSLDAVSWIGWAELLLERWDDALRHFDKAVHFAVRADCRLVLPRALAGQVFALLTQGRLAEARTAVEQAVDIAKDSGSREQLIRAYSMQGWTNIALGHFESALEDGRIATSHIRGLTRNWSEALALRVLAEARLMVGDYDGCRALIAAVGGERLPLANIYSRIAWFELLTRAELGAGRPEAAAEWAKAAALAAATVGQTGRIALARLAQAQTLLAQDPESALLQAELAADGLDLAGMKIDALRARMVLGAAMWHQGRPDDAARELKAVQLAFEQLGASAMARLARTERRRLSARVPRRPRGTVAQVPDAALTDRERQVADLVRDGLTNRMIAKRLSIAEKTVEMHLSRVFAKLGVPNRAAVAAVVTVNRPPAAPATEST